MPRPLALPLGPDAVRDLQVGDEVLLRGRIVTGRAPAHRWLAAAERPEVRALAEGSLVYHCAPVVARQPGGGWRLLAAGPSASMRMEEWQAAVIARYGLRAVLGKGGMGPRTLEALQARGAVYLHAAGGLAVGLARCVVRVHAVHQLEELGAAEALWAVEVVDFPAIVTMDAHGRSLHQLASGDAGLLVQQLMGPAPGSAPEPSASPPARGRAASR